MIILKLKEVINLKYSYSTSVKNNDIIRKSFNELTRNTFCFDFVNWYQSGHWGELYIPHVLLDGEKVISNVSVNLMQFDMCGQKKNYLQLGTIMTDLRYRNHYNTINSTHYIILNMQLP